jgi:hypothetical protein
MGDNSANQIASKLSHEKEIIIQTRDWICQMETSQKSPDRSIGAEPRKKHRNQNRRRKPWKKPSKIDAETEEV